MSKKKKIQLEQKNKIINVDQKTWLKQIIKHVEIKTQTENYNVTVESLRL